MGFNTDYLNNYTSLMERATAAGSPYDLTKQFVTDEFNNFNITEKEKAEILANFIANITTNITTAAMQTAMALTDKEGKYPAESANIVKQGALLDAQIAKVNADTGYVETQEDKLIEQVEHNKLIKAMDSMGDMIGTVGAGGLKPTASMWSIYFNLNQQLSGIAPTGTEDIAPAT
jgi:hypothetical protein